VVDQLTYCIGEPFVVFVNKNTPKEKVREEIVNRMLDLRILYEYGKDPQTKLSIIRELTFEQKSLALMYYCEYKTSRRSVIYEEFSLREPAKDGEFLEYKQGTNYIHMAMEVQVDYQVDEQKRGNGGNALKIYSNQ
jgi:hypothetical protein